MVNDKKMEGKGEQAKGRVQEAFGDLTGDQSHQDKGEARQHRGKLKEAGGAVQDKLDDAKDAVTGS